MRGISDTVKRGRPAGQITGRRRQVLSFIRLHEAAKGARPTKGAIVRHCSFYDRSTLNRVIRDLENMGLLASN